MANGNLKNICPVNKVTRCHSIDRCGRIPCTIYSDFMHCHLTKPVTEKHDPFKEVFDIKSTDSDKKQDILKYDHDKLRYDLIEPVMSEGLVVAFMSGLKKGYREGSWKDVKPFKPRYYGAAIRHIEKWRKGENHAEDTGVHHLAAALWNIGVLLWYCVVVDGIKLVIGDNWKCL